VPAREFGQSNVKNFEAYGVSKNAKDPEEKKFLSILKRLESLENKIKLQKSKKIIK
jgi:hypothetical protein